MLGRLSGCAELYAASGSDEPWNSGDGLCFLKRSEKAGRKLGLPDAAMIRAAYDKYYQDEKFVRVLPEGVCPETKW